MSNRRTPSPPSGPTLLQILQLPNPKVKDKWTGSSYGNTKGTFDEIELDNDHPSVQPWAEFTFKAIYLAYGHLLDQKMTTLKPEYQLVVGPSPGQSMLIITIKQETDVDNLGSAWSVNVLRTPIAVAATQLRSQGATQDSSQNGMTALCRERIYWVKPKVYSQGYTRLTPDWVSNLLPHFPLVSHVVSHFVCFPPFTPVSLLFFLLSGYFFPNILSRLAVNP
jgi:hypothetical protein